MEEENKKKSKKAKIIFGCIFLALVASGATAAVVIINNNNKPAPAPSEPTNSEPEPEPEPTKPDNTPKQPTNDEQTKKEEAEAKAIEEKSKKVLAGDVSVFNGTYKNKDQTLIIKNDRFEISGGDTYKTKDMQKITHELDESFKFAVDEEAFFQISPNGDRIDFCKNAECTAFSKN